eukprot:CAMPEP_0195570974 /NCGR_PEP_ID=MMETSP0814-20130614/3806_1 /TAXON_ID=97485 /ORGANISM="Prymnesium parvum, Strain Texoma1" /LENGTH=102 /DNA_ID=CAMNT_0040706545 /DNA_START=459 /DNA_END=767 /DNA_ORIENTATION=-
MPVTTARPSTALSEGRRVNVPCCSSAASSRSLREIRRWISTTGNEICRARPSSLASDSFPSSRGMGGLGIVTSTMTFSSVTGAKKYRPTNMMQQPVANPAHW